MPERHRSFDPFVAFDAAVLDGDDAVSSGGNIRLVGDKDDRVAFFVELFKKVHDLDRGL